MKLNPLPDEQQSPQLIEHVKKIYKMSAADRESLARIETQVAAWTRSQPTKRPHAEQEHLPNLEQVLHCRQAHHTDRSDGWNPLVRPGERGPISRDHPQNAWRYRLNLLAALLVVALICGSTAAIFATLQHRNATNSLTTRAPYTPAGPQTTYEIRQPIHLTSGSRLAMISDKVSWVIGSNAQETNWSELVRTTDGGKTWQQVKLPEGSSALGYTVVIDAVTALVPVSDILSKKYWITFDGGASWQHLDLPEAGPGLENNLEPDILTFLDHTQAWIIEPGGAGSSEQRALFHSGNAGKSWQKVASVPIEGFIFGFVFTDMQTGWLITENPGKGSALYATHDGGKTWKLQHLPAPPIGKQTPNMLRNLTFTSKRDGYVFFEAG